jgi:hypothetical protein
MVFAFITEYKLGNRPHGVVDVILITWFSWPGANAQGAREIMAQLSERLSVREIHGKAFRNFQCLVFTKAMSQHRSVHEGELTVAVILIFSDSVTMGNFLTVISTLFPLFDSPRETYSNFLGYAAQGQSYPFRGCSITNQLGSCRRPHFTPQFSS